MRTESALGPRPSALGDDEVREPSAERRAPLVAADDEAPAPEVLLIRVSDDDWALPATAAQEVVRWRPVTRVPGAPPWVVGLVNLRGAVVPVADLTLRLSGRPVNRARAWIVLVEDGARRGG